MEVREPYKLMRLCQLQFDMAKANFLSQITYIEVLYYRMAYSYNIFAFQDFLCLTSFLTKVSSVNVTQF
jgi:hypothetical protein